MAKIVYTKQRYWRHLGKLEQTLGNYPAPWQGAPYRLTVRLAAMNLRCIECGVDILQLEKHGGKAMQIDGDKVILRFCMGCVVPVSDKPDTIYARNID